MNTQKPLGPSDMKCPWWRKPMCKVCHTCPLWIPIRGKNPNTGEQVDEWRCSFAWGPMLQIETAQQARSGAAATESFRNEVVKRQDAATRLDAPKNLSYKQIEN